MAERYNRSGYAYGSAAVSIPDYEPEKIRKAKLDYRKRARLEVERRVLEKKAERPDFSIPNVIIIVSVIAMLISAASLYLVERSVNHDVKASIAELQRDYQTVVQENALKENIIEKQIDYTEVYRYATEELHMAVPERHQVISYSGTADEYVVRNGSIPNE